MKIGFFCFSLSGAGPRVRARNLIEGLAERTPHEVTLVTSKNESFNHPEVDVRRLLTRRNLSDPRTALRTRRALADTDVVHVPVNAYQLLYVGLLGIGPRVAGAGIQHDRAHRTLTRLVGVERMIETHEYVAETWAAAGVPATYIYPAVNGDRFHPYEDDHQDLRDELRIPDGEKIVLYVGELKPLKGAHIMSDVARQLDDDITVVVAGDGELRDQFENRDDLLFEGFVENEDLPGYYNAADVTIVPSEHESFSIVSLESIACGTPVVTTTAESSTMARIFKDRGTYVWADRTSDSIVDSVDELLADRQYYEQQVARGFETIDELGLTIDQALEQYVAVYESAARKTAQSL